MEDSELRQHLLEQICDTHGHFVLLMEGRLASVEVGDLERYFGFLSALVAKLDDEGKTLRQVMRETAAEAAPLILAELSAG
jgi:hypothetical protein